MRWNLSDIEQQEDFDYTRKTKKDFHKYARIIEDIRLHIRDKLKHGKLDDKEVEFFSDLQDKFYEIILENDVDFNNLF
jgi:hypothetical protein